MEELSIVFQPSHSWPGKTARNSNMRKPPSPADDRERRSEARRRTKFDVEGEGEGEGFPPSRKPRGRDTNAGGATGRLAEFRRARQPGCGRTKPRLPDRRRLSGRCCESARAPTRRPIPRSPIAGRPSGADARGESSIASGWRIPYARSPGADARGESVRRNDPSLESGEMGSKSAWPAAVRAIGFAKPAASKLRMQDRDPGHSARTNPRGTAMAESRAGRIGPDTRRLPRRGSRFPQAGKRRDPIAIGPSGLLTRPPDGRRNPRRAPISPS